MVDFLVSHRISSYRLDTEYRATRKNQENLDQSYWVLFKASNGTTNLVGIWLAFQHRVQTIQVQLMIATRQRNHHPSSISSTRYTLGKANGAFTVHTGVRINYLHVTRYLLANGINSFEQMNTLISGFFENYT